MSFTIAITGKGGVGKTTIAALIVQRLVGRGRRPVLAVDADPNSCLDAALGVSVGKSLGTVREEARDLASRGLGAGTSKQELLELKIAESLVEADDFDLIAMGRPEGPGCYCYANNVLKQVLAQISEHYPYVVIDNEAGLENLSRRIVQRADLLVMVADPSRRGLETLARLHALAGEMGIQYGQLALVVNRSRVDTPPELAESIRTRAEADQLLVLPEDSTLAQLGEAGSPLAGLPDGHPINSRLDGLLGSVGI